MSALKFCIIILAFCMFEACKKEDKVDRISSELKKRFTFKKGSYWIYKDSITGRYDTFTVTAFSNAIGNEPNYIESQVSSIRSSRSDSFSFNVNLTGSYLRILFQTFNIASGVSYPYQKQYKIYEKYHIDGSDFDSVVERYFASSDGGWDSRSSCFIKTDIGFVKMRFVTDSINNIWELKEWKILN
ncbi:MAG: hypothetical protein K9G49_07675 [Taibaiella sp.]|nr:hypothetical protein [Taibaiella sp.]